MINKKKGSEVIKKLKEYFENNGYDSTEALSCCATYLVAQTVMLGGNPYHTLELIKKTIDMIPSKEKTGFTE